MLQPNINDNELTDHYLAEKISFYYVSYLILSKLILQTPYNNSVIFGRGMNFEDELLEGNLAKIQSASLDSQTLENSKNSIEEEYAYQK